MSDRVFHDRRDAGRVLAGLLDRYRGRPDVLVLALPRGGVPVGYEVATALGAPLDVFMVRKLGVPGRGELAMGAIASGGIITINEDVVRGLDVKPDVFQGVVEREGRELARREQAYREAPESSGRELGGILANEVVCATAPSPFVAVGASYWDFTQTTDEEVRLLLRAAATSRPALACTQGR